LDLNKFSFIALLFRDQLKLFLQIDVQYITYAIWILVFDALVIIPFSKLRVTQRPIKYAIIKIANVVVFLLLNIFFLIYLPKIAKYYPDSFLGTNYVPDYQIGYIFYGQYHC
jgi:hypothetical protein